MEIKMTPGTPVERLIKLAATLTHLDEELTEFGQLRLKSGQIARWGKDLKGDLPFTYQEGTKGIFQIHDPATKMHATMNRGVDRLAKNADEWWRHKNLYVSDLQLPKKYQARSDGKVTPQAIAGGRALAKFHNTLLPHLDRRGITARTTAGAYEEEGVINRAQKTMDLVRGYQKRGFKIDPEEDSNIYNIGVKRSPGAKPQQPSTHTEIESKVGQISRKWNRKDFRTIGRAAVRGAAPAALGAAGAATTVRSIQTDEPSTRSTGVAVAGAATAVAGTGIAYAQRDSIRAAIKSVTALGERSFVTGSKRVSTRYPTLAKAMLKRTGFI